MGFYLWPKGWAKPLVVNWQIMAVLQQVKNCLCVSCSLWTTTNILKGANEVNREYFQQAVLLCLLKALYYAGIFSYAACTILCPKLCWHNLPGPIRHSLGQKLLLVQKNTLQDRKLKYLRPGVSASMRTPHIRTLGAPCIRLLMPVKPFFSAYQPAVCARQGLP